MGNAEDGLERAHSALGASKSSRWMNCPGSVALEETLPDPPPSEHAREGTCAHKVGELVLTSRAAEPMAYVGEVYEDIEVDEEMAEHVQKFTDYCRSKKWTKRWIEKTFSLASLNPPKPMFGSADFVGLLAHERLLEIVDLKYGKGIKVDPFENSQLKYYGLGVVIELLAEFETRGEELPIDTVRLTIIQPRVSDEPKSYDIDLLDLFDFATELLERARATMDPNAPLKAGDHCTFCKAAARCPEKQRLVQEMAQMDFTVLTPDTPNYAPLVPTALTEEQFYALLPKLHLVEGFVKACWAHAFALAERGVVIPGFKLVAKKANRSWVDEEETKKFLLENPTVSEDDLWVKKLVSPAQAEKLVGKKNLPERLTQKKSSGNTLVPDHDPREAVKALTAGDEFGVIDPSTQE